MKKLFGASVLSAMLILGQPLMAFADTTGAKVINFEDLRTLILEKNIDVQINENDRLKTYAGYSGLKRDIKDLEDELDDLDNERDNYRDAGNSLAVIGLGAEKRGLLEALKQLERTEVDRPTLEALTDLQASMSDDSLILAAESVFIGYNQLKIASADIALGIQSIQDQLVALQLRESLGMVSRNNKNELITKLVDMKTKLESVKLQQDSMERQLKSLLNDRENTLVIGSLPANYEVVISEDVEIIDEEDVKAEAEEVVSEDGGVIEDDEDVISAEDTDFEKVLENSYMAQLQEHQIVILQATLERIKKDTSMSSNQYKQANFDLMNAELKLLKEKDKLRLDYNNALDEIAKKQSDLQLAELNLEDAKVVLSEAQVRMGLGMLSKLEMDSAINNVNVQQNAVKTKQIELFNAKSGYNWLLQGMPRS